MVLFSIGLPSRFAEWCDALALRLAERRFGSAEAVALNGLEDLATAAIRSKAASLVACCRQPVPRLQTELINTGRPFLLALGNPQAALRHLVAGGQFAFADATRAVASGCASLLAITKASNALVLTPADAVDARAVAAAVARHFEIPIEREALPQLLDGLPDPGSPRDDAADASLDDLNERDLAVASGALDAYVGHFAGAPLDRLIWEPELFYTAGDPSAPGLLPVSGPIELTGRTRFLVYGPFINLPSGAWSANLVLGFSPEAVGMSFIVEVFAGAQLAHSRVTVTGDLVSDIRLFFTIESTADQPVQIRIHNERAAFDGRLALGYVAMTPQAAVSDETRERLADALRH
jgi:hypothetical protein